MANKQQYIITTKSGKKLSLTTEEFKIEFDRPGHNFQTRLEQLQTFFTEPIADWDLEDVQ